jgi:lipopolysaccharide/colanic/teichoic acid biosynthesis glycosyltransferase
MLRDSPNLPGSLIISLKDPRLLPMGSFSRKAKINELTQLVNIFLGQMSIIGYRPFAEVYYKLHSE